MAILQLAPVPQTLVTQILLLAPSSDDVNTGFDSGPEFESHLCDLLSLHPWAN